MISVLLLLIGVAILVLSLVAGATKSERILKLMIKKKDGEPDDAYIKRATKMSLVFGAVFVVMGLLMYFPIV